MRDKMRLHERRNHDDGHTEAAQREVTGCIVRAQLRRNIVRRNHLEWRHVIIDAAAFIISKDEDRVVPGGAVHQGINKRLDVSRAELDIRVRVLVQTAAAKSGINPHNGRKIGIRRGAAEDIKIILDWSGLLANRKIVPIGKAGQENSVLIIVGPAHSGILQAGEDSRTGPLWSAGWSWEDAAL